MAYRDFISSLHKSTRRDYLERVVKHDKAECAQVAKRFDHDYWDGDRRYGFGGYKYDGRWRQVADELVAAYGIKPGMSVLDVGCGMGFLLYEITQVCPGVKISGIDISEYAIEHAKPEIRDFVQVANATSLPFADDSFDLVFSLNTLHNLYISDLAQAISEIERVGRGDKYLVVESYRNEQEKVNLMYWQLTCECFFAPAEWEWLLAKFGYRGDHSFIFFE